MVAKKQQDTTVKTYEIGLKNRKALTVKATRMVTSTYTEDMKFMVGNEAVFTVARGKWEYVRLVEPVLIAEGPATPEGDSDDTRTVNHP